MIRTKKSEKRMRIILNAVLIAALLIGSMSLCKLNAQAVTFPESDNSGIAVLEAKIIEKVEWDSDIVPYTMLTRCQISVSGDSKGMHIDISTGCVGTASVLGVKDVKVHKKNWLGGWDVVATCSGAELYNRSSMGISVVYEDAVKGATYKITCVHYGDVDGYIEGDNDSGSFTFTY